MARDNRGEWQLRGRFRRYPEVAVRTAGVMLGGGENNKEVTSNGCDGEWMVRAAGSSVDASSGSLGRAWES